MAEPESAAQPPRVLGKKDTRAHLRRLKETDPDLDRKAEAWAAYFQRAGVPRTPAAIMEAWARLEAEAPPWPPER